MCIRDRLIVLQLVLNALPVEGMGAREDIELSLKDGLEADVAHLAGGDGQFLVLLLSLLLPELLSCLGVLLKLFFGRFDLLVVIVQTLTEMLLHVLDFLVWREQRQEIVNLELRLLQDL